MRLKTGTAFLLIFLAAFNISGFSAETPENPDNKEAARQHYLRGNIYYREGMYREAQEQFNLALEATKAKKEVSAQPKEKAAAAPQAQPGKPAPELEYTIGDEDVLNISVWQNPDLNQEIIVRPDGKISFPLIGDVVATGRTITKLDDEITTRLKEYIRYPQVSISIKKLGGKRILVLGEVMTPGVYSVTGRRRVLEAIAMAGGFTTNAVVSSVIVIQGGLANPKGVRLNLNRTLLKADFRQNIVLNSEDIVFVPKKFVANVNYLVNSIVGPIAQGTYNTENLYNRRW